MTPKRDTSSNDTSSTTTLRLKFLSNYQFVEKSVRRIHFRRKAIWSNFFPELISGQISGSRHVVYYDQLDILTTFLVFIKSIFKYFKYN